MNTLVTILTKPNLTFEYLEKKYEDVTNPDYDVIFMMFGALSGLISFLKDHESFIPFNIHPAISGLFAVLLVAGFSFVMYNYIIAPITYWLGKVLKGQADMNQVRMVIAYSLIPAFLRIPYEIYYNLINNRAVDVNEYWIIAGVSILISIWIFKIEIQGLMFFNRFGLFKAVINILPFLIVRGGIIYYTLPIV